MSGLDNQTAAQDEPVDIAQAFRMVNQANQKPAESSVEESEPESDEAGIEVDNREANPEVSVGEPESDIDLGGSSDGLVEPVDYDNDREVVLKEIQDNAVKQVRDEMHEQGIELYTMNDLVQRDEDTGVITFRNPDNPNMPFQSRNEAQLWINSINDDINQYFRNQVNKKQQELVQQELPRLAVIDFAPTYNAMSEIEQEIMDDLLEPYAILDSNDNVIGFNANLESVANVARQMATKYSRVQQSAGAESEAPAQKQEDKPSKKPAMDLKTGNSLADPAGVGDEEFEPKNLAEALKHYDKMNRK